MSPWGTVLPVACPRCGAALTRGEDGYTCRLAPEHYSITVEEVEAISAALASVVMS